MNLNLTGITKKQTLIMCVGNSKTLIKFGAWLFLIILENQEENL